MSDLESRASEPVMSLLCNVSIVPHTLRMHSLRSSDSVIVKKCCCQLLSDIVPYVISSIAFVSKHSSSHCRRPRPLSILKSQHVLPLSQQHSAHRSSSHLSLACEPPTHPPPQTPPHRTMTHTDTEKNNHLPQQVFVFLINYTLCYTASLHSLQHTALTSTLRIATHRSPQPPPF